MQVWMGIGSREEVKSTPFTFLTHSLSMRSPDMTEIVDWDLKH